MEEHSRNAADLISRVRDHYLEQFLGFVRIQRERWPTGHAEVKFELSEQSGLFRRLYCTDFVAKDGGNLIVREMQPDRILTFDPFTYEVRGVPVVIERLIWDDIEVHHDAVTLDNQALELWFDYWFDPDDARLDPASDIGGIVHSLSIGSRKLNADLGTAEPEALRHTLELIAKAGATNIRVTSGREAE